MEILRGRTLAMLLRLSVGVSISTALAATFVLDVPDVDCDTAAQI